MKEKIKPLANGFSLDSTSVQVARVDLSGTYIEILAERDSMMLLVTKAGKIKVFAHGPK